MHERVSVAAYHTPGLVAVVKRSQRHSLIREVGGRAIRDRRACAEDLMLICEEDVDGGVVFGIAFGLRGRHLVDRAMLHGAA